MSEMGDDFKLLKTMNQEKALDSFEKGMASLPKIKEILAPHRVEIVTSNNDRHWRFLQGTLCLFQFWPSSNKAMKMGRQGSSFVDGPRDATAQVLQILAAISPDK